MDIAARVKGLDPFLVMDVLERAQELERQGADIVHLEIGEPDFETPACVAEAARQAIGRGETHYTHSQGLLPLREAICAHYHERYRVSLSPEQVLVTSGTSPAMLALFSTLLEQGDEVITSDPCYACYHNFIRFPGGVPVTVPVQEEDNFQYRPEAVHGKLSPRTRLILANSPANPTGTLLSPKRLQALAELGPYVVSDEIYHGLTYEGSEHSILEMTDRAFVFNGFSKLYAMTGWRLGYLIAPKRFVPALRRLCQSMFISAGSVAQWAGLAALTQAAGDVERMRRTYDERRRHMLTRLRQIGLTVASEPAGAFYILANAKAFTTDSLSFAYELLEQAHVAVTPGIDFGPGAEGYIRFSYATGIDRIEQGLARIDDYLRLGRAARQGQPIKPSKTA